MIEQTMHAHAAHMRAVVRFQQAVVAFRRVQSSHQALHNSLRESLHDTLAKLAESRQAAAESREAVHAAVRAFVHVLRDADRPPEVALKLTKRTVTAIVVALPPWQEITDSKPLLDDAVQWAIEAYYDAA
jgi:leucyl-tRNA synthetase